MSSDFTQLILLHHYRSPKPAVDESDFLSHGLCRETQFLPDGAKPSSGALEFGPNSVVKVPLAPHWENLRAIIVDVLVRFDGTINSRRNIVEADGIFAFYLAPNGDVRFDIFALVAGSAAPGWHGVSSSTHALADPWHAEPGQWSRLRVAFDGITTARIWVDGVIVAQRSDFLSSIGTPGGDGVSIGNWTLSNQHPLLGALDWVAIWKLDEDAVTRDFLERLDPDARTGWGRLMACLNTSIDDERLTDLLRLHQDLLVATSACIANADEATREEFFDTIEEYQQLWASNQIHDGAYVAVLQHVHRMLTIHCGSSIADGFVTMANAFAEIIGPQPVCYERGAIDSVDPKWRQAIEHITPDTFS